jgi:ribosome biogenesis GTPase / thiamine phosphate phosphatase
MRLQQLGWNGWFEAAWNSTDRGSRNPARIIDEHRELWLVKGEFGEARAEAAGKLRLSSENGGAWPAVGDWVGVEGNPGSGLAICEVLQRRSTIARKAVGKCVERQVLAANVDKVFLVMSLDGDYNPRRLERYLAQVWDSGARPLVVLNKTDLCTAVASRLQEIERLAMGAPVCAVSALTSKGMCGLEPQLQSGETVVLLGSSGVGKSSLVNRLMGRESQLVNEVRAHDSRGQHTTTARQLLFLPSGAMIIDTPGLRELQLWDAQEGLEHAFGEIEELAGECRFRDCTHQGEPGCAVRAAVLDGRLDAVRLENYRKLQREMEFLERKIDLAARQKEKQRIKTVHRSAQKYYQQRKRNEGM